MIKRKIPAGTRDKLFRLASGSYELEKQFHKVVEKRGFQKIETPVIEYDAVFSESPNARYQFFDAQQDLLTLRSDLTTPIGRVIEMTNLELPLKLSYAGKVFRANEEMRGEQNEITQVGIELIGFPNNFKAEVECLQTATTILKEMNLTNFHFELGHAKLFKKFLKIVSDEVLNQEEKELVLEEFKTLLLEKNISGLEKFVKKYPTAYDDLIVKLPFLYGKVENVLAQANEILTPISDNKNIQRTLNELENLLLLLKNTLGNHEITIDLGLVPTMNYYTGILFNAYADEISEAFLRGGRYNELVTSPTDKISAVGFAIHLDNIVKCKYKNDSLQKPRKSKILIHYEKNEISLAYQLLDKTMDAQLSLFDSLDEAKAFAKKWSFEEVWHVIDGKVMKMEEENGR